MPASGKRDYLKPDGETIHELGEKYQSMKGRGKNRPCVEPCRRGGWSRKPTEDFLLMTKRRRSFLTPSGMTPGGKYLRDRKGLGTSTPQSATTMPFGCPRPAKFERSIRMSRNAGSSNFSRSASLKLLEPFIRTLDNTFLRQHRSSLLSGEIRGNGKTQHNPGLNSTGCGYFLYQ